MTLVIYFPTQVLTLLFVVGKTCSIKFDYPSMRCDGKMTQKGALTLQFLIYLLCDLSSKSQWPNERFPMDILLKVCFSSIHYLYNGHASKQTLLKVVSLSRFFSLGKMLKTRPFCTVAVDKLCTASVPSCTEIERAQSTSRLSVARIFDTKLSTERKVLCS